ncbi:MAG: hypothetical protein HN341_09120 [Verrucomicrobia bacterium]|jgi:hypothetical protein|nr:hypothetical protein [Verrucomicrobiota bacterium]
MRISRRHAAAAAVAALLTLSPTAQADRNGLPEDFDLSPVTFGGAGGGTSRDEARMLSHCPVILVPDQFRDHSDWTGQNTGLGATTEGDVYAALLREGFQPIEIWMIDFAPANHYMTSIEEATDDLKFFITAVMAYTGADRVQIVAHGTGGLLARLTLLKYSIAHWVAAEVYIDTPFHGMGSDAAAERTLMGDPNAWVLTAGSPLLREILIHGETPTYPDPVQGMPFSLPTLTIRGASASGGSALRGADNLLFPELGHDTLRCAPAAIAAYAAFLRRTAVPLLPEQDADGDGFRGKRWGGPDFEDGDPTIFPGAFERSGDGIDQDCNGCDQVPHGSRDIEVPIMAQEL